jgi:hypothetical protein
MVQRACFIFRLYFYDDDCSDGLLEALRFSKTLSSSAAFLSERSI